MKRSANNEQEGGHNHQSWKKQTMHYTNLKSISTPNKELLQQIQDQASLVGKGTQTTQAIGGEYHRPSHFNHLNAQASTKVQEQQRNQGSLYERHVQDYHKSDDSLSNKLFQNSRSLSSQRAATTGMTFSVDGGALRGSELDPNQSSNRNMSNLLFSPRVSAMQNQLHLLKEEQKNVRNEQAKQEQVKQMETIMRATLAIQQDQHFKTALLVHNATRVANQRNQEIDRLRREIRIMEQVRQQQQGPYRDALSIPTAVSAHMSSTSSFLPLVGQSMLGLNQSAFSPLQQDMGSSGLYQRLDDRGTTTALQLQNRYALDVAYQAMNSPSISSLLSRTTQFDASNADEASVNGLLPGLIPLSLPVILGQFDTSRSNLSEHQMLLRQQIEIFEASVEDVATHMRGRNKTISLGQVGLRCKHCAHMSVNCRQKGSTYFPSTKSGVYQAAQNMSTTHIANGLCVHTPASVKLQFAIILNKKQNSLVYQKTGSGRQFWIQSISLLGLIDTEDHGIRFVRNWPRNV